MRICLLVAMAWPVLGCQREAAEEAPEGQAPDTEADAATEADVGTISPADVAGTWDMRSVPETGDTTATVFQIQVTPDSWILMLPNRDPIEGVVSTSGDSIIVEAGPYESVRRSGLTVRTRTAFRLEGDRLVGRTVARYETSEADSVLRLRSEGTRAP
jgi:hypothetical protein